MHTENVRAKTGCLTLGQQPLAVCLACLTRMPSSENSGVGSVWGKDTVLTEGDRVCKGPPGAINSRFTPPHRLRDDFRFFFMRLPTEQICEPPAQVIFS